MDATSDIARSNKEDASGRRLSFDKILARQLDSVSSLVSLLGSRAPNARTKKRSKKSFLILRSPHEICISKRFRSYL